MDQKKGHVERTSEKAGTINPVWNEERILYVALLCALSVRSHRDCSLWDALRMLARRYPSASILTRVNSDVPDLPSVLDNLYVLVEVWERDKKFLGWAEVQFYSFFSHFHLLFQSFNSFVMPAFVGAADASC